MEETVAMVAPEATEEQQIIVIKQLPIIQEQLYRVKSQVEAVVADALALEVTEDTVTAIKNKRAELNKMFAAFEERRKEVKKAVLAPYDAFEEAFKECITVPFRGADAELKGRIAEVEDGVKDAKRAEVAAYFTEYAESLGIDFVSFESMNLKVGLSDSRKKLQTAAKTWLDAIDSGIKMIATFQEHADEIMAEFKRNGYDANAAVVTVSNRHKAIEREQKLAEERKQREAEQAAREAQLQAELEAQKAAMPQNEPLVAPVSVGAPTEQKPVESGNGVSDEFIAPQEVYQATFTITGTLEELKAVKKFLIDGGYKYVAE